MKKIFQVFLFTILASKSIAQNTTSPYSILGIGDIEKSNFDVTAGMGHAGVALTADRTVLTSNPAALSFLTNPLYSNPFYLDVAVRYKNVSFSGDAIKNSSNNISNDLQFKRLSFSIKPKKYWGLSLGFLPYSNSNYSFSSIKKINGDVNSIPANYEGSGSTNLLYLSNSYLVKNKLSIGLQSGILFGQFNDKEILYSAITDSVLYTEENTFMSSGYFKGGIIYKDSLSKDWCFSFGATGNLKTGLNAHYEKLVKDGNTSLLSTKRDINNYSYIPAAATFGVALHYKANYTFVADYAMQNWSSLNIKGANYSLTNSDRFSIGVQYKQLKTFRDRGVTFNYEKYFYQVGFYNNNSYLKLNGNRINEWAFTFGAGANVGNGNLTVTGNIEIGSRGTTNNGLLKENFTQATLTLGYRDFWNTKKARKYN